MGVEVPDDRQFELQAVMYRNVFSLEADETRGNNDRMVIPGKVQNGVVVLEKGYALPEGASVTVNYPAQPITSSAGPKRRIQVPLVRTGEPGSVQLTGERIAQEVDEHAGVNKNHNW